jgi:uncharacterized membrane protein
MFEVTKNYNYAIHPLLCPFGIAYLFTALFIALLV